MSVHERARLVRAYREIEKVCGEPYPTVEMLQVASTCDRLGVCLQTVHLDATLSEDFSLREWQERLISEEIYTVNGAYTDTLEAPVDLDATIKRLVDLLQTGGWSTNWEAFRRGVTVLQEEVLSTLPDAVTVDAPSIHPPTPPVNEADDALVEAFMASTEKLPTPDPFGMEDTQVVAFRPLGSDTESKS